MNRLEQRVCHVVAAFPDRLAVDAPAEQLTYAELDALANRFAHVLAGLGVKPGDRVGVHMPRSGRAIAALLGTLRLGAAYVPLDPGSPPARIALIAEDCGLRHVVISPQLLSAWLGSNERTPVEHFLLSADGPVAATPHAKVHGWREVLQASAEPLSQLTDSDPDALAYILYTSGSTGKPKGVMLSHRNALAFVDWAADQIALTASDRVASVAPFHFDLSVFDVWASLRVGACAVIVDETTVVSGPRMLERIRSKQISVWYSVPSAWVLMLDHAELESVGAPSLRAVYFAGEVFPMKHLRRAMQALPSARFFNLFGPTETNVCLAHALEEVPDEHAAAIPIGQAACGDHISILNETGEPVARGEKGELFVAGPTVMLGYWNAGNPLRVNQPYATGDLVSEREDGALLYHGRRDHLVKVHGHRVELGEVESALLRHDAVQEVVAFVAGQELAAVIVAEHADLSVLAIKQHCAAHLPRYMIPAAIRLVQSLPRTSSGKVDRVAVKNAFEARSELREDARKELSWKRA